MRGNKKQSIAQSKKYVVIPKKQFKIFLENQTKWAEKTFDLRRNMRKLITEEVTKQIGDKIEAMEGLYKEIIIQKKIFQEKGYIDQEEINKKYEELKKKRG